MAAWRLARGVESIVTEFGAVRDAPQRKRLSGNAGIGLGDERALHRIEILERAAGAAGYARKRVVGNVDGHLRRLRHAPIKSLQQRATTGQHDALVHDVRDQLGRGLLDRVLDRVDDLLRRLLQGITNLLRVDLDRTRQAGQQVAAAQRYALFVPIARVRGADGDLDVFRSPL